VFEQLATQHASKGKVAFVKVDTDQNRDIVSQYSISAMPTFLVFNGSSVVETIRGTNAGSLRAAVAKAVSAAKGSGGGAAFESKGYRLGSEGNDKPKPSSSSDNSKTAQRAGTGSGGRRLGAAGTAAAGSGPGIDIGDAASSMVRFMGLYLVTLLSLDPYNAAENSPLSMKSRR